MQEPFQFSDYSFLTGDLSGKFHDFDFVCFFVFSDLIVLLDREHLLLPKKRNRKFCLLFKIRDCVLTRLQNSGVQIVLEILALRFKLSFILFRNSDSVSSCQQACSSFGLLSFILFANFLLPHASLLGQIPHLFLLFV